MVRATNGINSDSFGTLLGLKISCLHLFAGRLDRMAGWHKVKFIVYNSDSLWLTSHGSNLTPTREAVFQPSSSVSALFSKEGKVILMDTSYYHTIFKNCCTLVIGPWENSCNFCRICKIIKIIKGYTINIEHNAFITKTCRYLNKYINHCTYDWSGQTSIYIIQKNKHMVETCGESSDNQSGNSYNIPIAGGLHYIATYI